MKHPLIAACAAVIFFGLASCSPMGGIHKPFERKVKTVVEREVSTFAARDTTSLFRLFSDHALTETAWNKEDGSYVVIHGLAALKNNYRKIIKGSPRPLAVPHIERKNWRIERLSRNWCWANFIQVIMDANGKPHETYETKLLHRESGGWRIVVTYAFVSPH